MDESVNTAAPEGVASQSANQPTNNIPGAAPGETKSETLARMYKVNVDGQESEVNEAELLRGYSHNKAAEKKMQEAANSRKEAETVLRMFKENPKEAFKIMGADARAFAEMVINDELAESMLSPEQKQLRDYKRELEQYQSNDKQAKEEYEKQQHDEAMSQYTEQIQSQITTALGSAGLPNTERTVGRMAHYMQAALAAGYENVTAQDVIEHVRNDYISDFKSFMGGMTEDQIEMFLGADVMRKAAKATVKTGMPNTKVDRSVNENKAVRESNKEKSTSTREYFKNIRRG
jgi:hypothetical protein